MGYPNPKRKSLTELITYIFWGVAFCIGLISGFFLKRAFLSPTLKNSSNKKDNSNKV